jgi:ferredoxin
VTLFAAVDAEKCCGYGLCAQGCPEVFELDENGFAHVHVDHVPAGSEEKAKDAVGSCPQDAVYVGTEPPAGRR